MRVGTLEEVQRVHIERVLALTRVRRRVVAVVLVVTAVALARLATADDLFLSDVTVIDGTGRPPVTGQDVVIRDGRVSEIRRHGGPIPSGALVPDVAGLFVVPGFVDMHAHVTFLRNSVSDADPGYDEAITGDVLRICLAHGITTVRNPMAPTREGVALREAVASGRVPGPRIYTAGWTINRPQFTTAAEVRKEVREQAAAGVDFVKVYAGLERALVRAAVEEAHARGVKVIGHLQATTWTEAARDGIDFIAHGAPWAGAYLPESRRDAYGNAIRDDGGMKARLRWLEWVDTQGPEMSEMVDELVRRRVVVDPTLVAYDTKFRGDDPQYLDSPDLSIAPPVMLSGWKRGTFTSDWTRADYARGHDLWPRVLGLVGLYHRRGVRLAAGSDLPNPWVVPGAGFHRELELLVQAGIPALEVLSIATRNGASGLGLDAGTLEPGRRADLVVLEANPLADIRNTRRIRMVVKEGRPWRPDDLLPSTPGGR